MENHFYHIRRPPSNVTIYITQNGNYSKRKKIAPRGLGANSFLKNSETPFFHIRWPPLNVTIFIMHMRNYIMGATPMGVHHKKTQISPDTSLVWSNIKKANVLKCPSKAWKRLWSNCTDAYAVLGLSLALDHCVGVGMWWLILVSNFTSLRFHFNFCLT